GMRSTPGTVGKTEWPKDQQGRPIYPEEFEALAARRPGQPMHPPGRDVRCIVSVGMLTEGWDCNTVTHIVGLRPFMSQLLCEQVVGRRLRRRTYEVGDGDLMTEEVAKVFGVPFQVVPFKADPKGGTKAAAKRHHVYAIRARTRSHQGVRRERRVRSPRTRPLSTDRPDRSAIHARGRTPDSAGAQVGRVSLALLRLGDRATGRGHSSRQRGRRDTGGPAIR